MATRLTRCPECREARIETVTIHNPDTHSMNARATLKCRTCGHVWEGQVTSPRYRELRRQGRIR